MLVVKIIGCILILGSCTGIGMHFSGELRSRIRDLHDIKKLIYLLKGDIRYAHTPLPEAVQALSYRHDGKFKEFLSSIASKLNQLGGISFYNIWKEAVDTKLSHTALTNKDLEQLSRLGESLGYLDKEVQLNTLELYIEQLENEIQELQKNVKEKTYMYNALGVMGGIFIVIVMI